MLQIFKTVEGKLTEIDEIQDGCWVHLTDPSPSECKVVIDRLALEPDYIIAALDEEESPRIENDEGQTLVIVDLPTVQPEGGTFLYNTIPLGIVHCEKALITVCLKESTIIDNFIEGRVRGFSTTKKTRFILQILYRNASRFLQYLKQIDKASTLIENELHKSMKNRELIQMLKLEKSLVYFSTSLTANELVMEKLLKSEYIKKYPEDTELLEDVIIENKQAIEMCNIYRDILSGTMDAFASIISNNLNIVMKMLAAITIVLAIPSIVSGFFGMNTWVPLEGTPVGFWIIVGIAMALSAATAFLLWRKKMF
ncbi:MAG: Magnesium transport protein CorA [Firmicutes bacterium ADurb.Bin182]|nr:MAG: Magnesium transport protein CorA [Firmicutes bacterium ADurb.Bin182]